MEIDEGRRLRAVRGIPIEGRVQVHAQDLLLGELARDPHRKRSLTQLARDAVVIADQPKLYELLCDRRAAFNDGMCADIGPGGAGYAAWTDARLVPEVGVLDCDGRLGHVTAHCAERHLVALITGWVQVRDH